MDVFDALADPIRRDLLLRLVRGPLRVVDLAAAHPISRPAVSKHLRILGEVGLVHATDLGRERHYSLRPDALAEVATLLDTLTGTAARPSPRPRITEHQLDALATEVRRASRDSRRAGRTTSTPNKENIA